MAVNCNIRAKFRCTGVKKVGDSEEIELYAVGGPDGTANAQWAKYTPAGTLRMTIDNPPAQGRFVEGNEYFLDFTDALPEA